MEEVEWVFDKDTSEHHPWIRGDANGAALRVPRDVVEPAEEVVEAVFVDVLSAAPVEMRIELMDDRLVDRVGEKADAERKNATEENNSERKKVRKLSFPKFHRDQWNKRSSTIWWI